MTLTILFCLHMGIYKKKNFMPISNPFEIVGKGTLKKIFTETFAQQ